MKLHMYPVKERNGAKNKKQNIRNFSSCVWPNLKSCNSELSNRRQQLRPQGAFARLWRWDPPPKHGKSLRVPWGRGWMIQHFYELVNKRIYWYNNFSSFTNNKIYPSILCVNRPRSMLLASQYWRKPRTPSQKWQSKTAEISRYCSAFPGYGGMRGFPLTRTLRVVFTRHEVAFGVVIRGVELYDLVKIEFWFSLRLRRLRSSENWVVEVESRGGRSKPITRRGNVSYASSSDSDNLVINGVRRKWKPSDSSDSDVVASRLCLRLRSLIFTDTVISALITLLGTPRSTQSLVKTSL